MKSTTTLARRLGWLALLLSLTLGIASVGAAQDAGPAADEKPAAATKFRGRLPAYFSRIVSQEQRQKIYEIQARFNEQVEALREQIVDLESTRDKEVREVLTPEQKKQVDELLAAAKAKRAGRAPATPEPGATPAGDDS
ncbi:MAG: hypothetical protein KDB14_08810 [Planctomycetales bacterium]|nr:hypothetical protein [Planctomycetales bacterium]